MYKDQMMPEGIFSYLKSSKVGKKEMCHFSLEISEGKKLVESQLNDNSRHFNNENKAS